MIECPCCGIRDISDPEKDYLYICEGCVACIEMSFCGIIRLGQFTCCHGSAHKGPAVTEYTSIDISGVVDLKTTEGRT
jgi:hypothetical protein